VREELSCENLNEAQLSQLNITPKEYENILNIQSSILHKLAFNHDYDDVLQHLCLLTEQLLPNSVASIMLVNKETGLINILSAPSIPQSGWKALENLKPGLGRGSCANAVFQNKPQYVSNTFEDDRWKDVRKVAFDFNICSCWSMPIKNENDETIGSFALSSYEHLSPAPFHKKLLETAAFIVNIVLKNKKHDEKIEYMLYHDSLTGLHNKTYLEELLNKKVKRTVLILDVNNFSYINNTYGFELGDKVLVKIANIFKNIFNFNEVCRLDSDQFVIVLNKDAKIKDTASQIKDYFYSYEIAIDAIALSISFTYGAVSGEKNLFKNAIISLKHAKTTGKNALHVFSEEEESVCFQQRKSFIEANNLLHHALLSDEIIPFFQGIRDNSTGEITKYEALCRIKKDDKVISPHVFLESAKSSGLLPDITKIMIEKSFKIMSDNDYTFSINLAEDDLIRHYVLEYINEKSQQYSIDPKRVTLEILEGISANGKKNHIKQLSALKKSGYSIAIDDFGIEYSNFERLLDLDIDFLKIDAKYIKDIDTNPKSYEIVQAIVFFAKNANIPCIAEFVHNESVQKVVKELGIEYSQGYYFNEPNPLPSP